MANQLFGKSLLNALVFLFRNDFSDAVVSFLKANSLILKSMHGSVMSLLLLFQMSLELTEI